MRQCRQCRTVAGTRFRHCVPGEPRGPSHVDVLVAARAAKIASKKTSKVLSLQLPSPARRRCPSISDSLQEPFLPTCRLHPTIASASGDPLPGLSLPSLHTPGLARRSARSTASLTPPSHILGCRFWVEGAMPCHALPCLAMPCHVGIARLSRGAIDITCPPIPLVRRTLRELGWPRIPGVQHRHNRWPRRIPPSMVEQCRKASPTGGGAVCSVCADTQTRRSEADQRAAGEIPACSPLARSFTMGDARCPPRRPPATGSENQPRCM